MKIARNVLWLVFERGLQVAFGIVTTGLIARAVGLEGFAEFQYAQSLVLMAASIALICGGEVVVPRLVAQPTPDAQHRLLAHVFVLRETAAVVGRGKPVATFSARLTPMSSAPIAQVSCSTRMVDRCHCGWML
ncbi:hypothetical protein CTP10_R62000 (plasmid) [Cupriavidus sp. P-10]|uniref:hypothetical protein n=1 Tax=unclassified Cupriavidus TaxID=2640874 RepID=UPI002185CD3C|nr:hypothetical protein [Cupriavidus sp. TA19]BDB28788.1 hypothetical protein CTP10_R62000 [Cupriavidus sp. P-10]